MNISFIDIIAGNIKGVLRVLSECSIQTSSLLLKATGKPIFLIIRIRDERLQFQSPCHSLDVIEISVFLKFLALTTRLLAHCSDFKGSTVNKSFN